MSLKATCVCLVIREWLRWH